MWYKMLCQIQLAFRSQVRIPAREYYIDHSELEITCHYSNSRAPGGSCATYDIEPSVDAKNGTSLYYCVNT